MCLNKKRNMHRIFSLTLLIVDGYILQLFVKENKQRTLYVIFIENKIR